VLQDLILLCLFCAWVLAFKQHLMGRFQLQDVVESQIKLMISGMGFDGPVGCTCFCL